MFDQATRLKLRFESKKGALSTEDLWDLPLTTLNDIAKALHKEVESGAEVSFIEPKPTAANRTAVLQFDIVKHIITTRLNENAAMAAARAKKESRQKLLEVLERKENQALEQLSADQIRAMIDAL